MPAVVCPCCDWMGDEFLPFGTPSRANALCPSCRSLERHRHLFLFLQRRTDILSAPRRVLHFAPEPSLKRALLANPSITYVGADLEGGGRKGGFLVDELSLAADVMQMPFADAAFDVVLCNHVLEHVPDDTKAMRELRRVLRPSGTAVLLVPLDSSRNETFEDPTVTDPSERTRLFGQWDHVRLYGRDYPDRLRAAGFEVTEVSYSNELSAEDRARYRPGTAPLFVCSRSRDQSANDRSSTPKPSRLARSAGSQSTATSAARSSR